MVDSEAPQELQVSKEEPPYPPRKLNGKRVADASWKVRSFCNTQLLLCIVGFIEGADMQLLPATFTALEADLGLSPAGLGRMSLAQSLSISLNSLLWGVLADSYSRKGLLVVSCLAWGVLTLLLAMCRSVSAMFVTRVVHGATLASLGPLAQSIVADISEPEQRGVVFGRVFCATTCGSIVSSYAGTTLASMTVASIPGWRFVFAIVAGISVLAALAIFWMMEEPPRDATASEAISSSKVSSRCSKQLRLAGSLIRIPTFLVIVGQGLFGCIPGNALGFLAMFLQSCGYAAESSAIIVSLTLTGRAIGVLLGGLLGDRMARRSPAHGRPCVAVVSVLLGIPFVFALIVASRHEASPTLVAILAFALGLVSSWCASGVNRPILAEIVQPSSRASIVALLSSLEGSSGALLGAPMVGLLAENVFGYVPLGLSTPSAASGLASAADFWPKQQAQNKVALSSAILWATVPPWIICAFLYSRLHWTYAQDVRKARAVAYAKVAPTAVGGSDDFE